MAMITTVVAKFKQSRPSIIATHFNASEISSVLTQSTTRLEVRSGHCAREIAVNLAVYNAGHSPPFRCLPVTLLVVQCPYADM